MAASGTIWVSIVPPALWRMVNASGSVDQVKGCVSILSMRASGGQSWRSLAVKCPPLPARRTSTPSPSLQTSPVNCSACASCQTKGRNPTPCTLPRTRSWMPLPLITTQNNSDDDVSNAARRRFSALICSSLSRSTQTSAWVGQASIQAGPASRW